MSYLSKEAQALLTLNADKARVESSAMLISNVGQAASGIVTSLLTAAAGATLDTAKPQLSSYLGRQIALAQELKTTNDLNVANSVENWLTQDYSHIIDLIKAGIGQGVGSIHASLYETLNGTNALMSSYIGLIARIGIDPHIARWVNRTIQPNYINTETAWYLKQLGKLDDVAFKKFGNSEGWDNASLDNLGEAWLQSLPWGVLIELVRKKVITEADFKAALKRYRYSDKAIGWATAVIPQVPEMYRAADIYAKGLVDQQKMLQAFEIGGVGSDWAIPFAEASFNVPSFSILAELKWRGIIDDATLLRMLSRSAVHPAVRDKMPSLLEQIPPAQDIITMVVREAFEADNIVSAPVEFAEWIAKKGYSSFWADKYWTAHFFPMPLNQAYDNLRRGYWDETKFKNLLRIADIHPRYHDDILKVAYHPPSIRELGYGYDVGAYSKDDIVKYRRWGGLNLQDATKATDSLIAYRQEAEKATLRRDYVQLFVLGKIDEQGLKTALKHLGTRDEISALWVSHAVLQKEIKDTDVSSTEPRTITRADAQWLFEHGVFKQEQLTSALETLGYSSGAIHAYVYQSLQRIKERTPAEPEPVVKNLSLSELKTAYKAGLINETYVGHKLVAMHYTEPDVKLILDIWNIEQPDAVVKAKSLTLTQSIKLYYNDLMTKEQLRQKLLEMRYTDNDASYLLSLIDISRPKPEEPKPVIEEEIKNKALTLSQIAELYYSGLLTEAQVIERLKLLNYSENDIGFVIELIRISIPQGKAAPTLSMGELEELYKYGYYDEPELTDVYIKRGYSDNDATLKTYLAMLGIKIPMLIAQYRNAWINSAQLYEEIRNLSIPFKIIGIPEKRLQEMMKVIVKNTQVERTIREKDLTKAEILKGAKNGILTLAQATELLESIGYETTEAQYLLTLNGVIAIGDPKNYWHMRQVTEAYKKSQGQPAILIPNELVELEEQRKTVANKIQALKGTEGNEQVLSELLVDSSNIDSRMATIRGKLNIT